VLKIVHTDPHTTVRRLKTPQGAVAVVEYLEDTAETHYIKGEPLLGNRLKSPTTPDQRKFSTSMRSILQGDSAENSTVFPSGDAVRYSIARPFKPVTSRFFPLVRS
jgi:hypothetical protein